MAAINTFDRSLKVIARNHAALFLRLALPDLDVTLTHQPENVELSLPVQPVDFVHRIIHQGEEHSLHIEFQLEHFADFPRRMCHVHGSLSQQFRLPVLSFVIYLKHRQAPLPDEYIVQMDGVTINRFTYPVIKLWKYVAEIRSGRLRELAPLLVILEETPDEETLRVERELILQESDPEKRADLLAIALTLASRIFDKEFLRRFFREELIQMEHATLIDEWLEEAVQEAVQEAEKKASYEGRLEQAIRSIILILTIRFKITDVQEESFLNRLKQITDITVLNALEEAALRAFNLDSFNAALNNLQTHPNSESAQ